MNETDANITTMFLEWVDESNAFQYAAHETSRFGEWVVFVRDAGDEQLLEVVPNRETALWYVRHRLPQLTEFQRV